MKTTYCNCGAYKCKHRKESGRCTVETRGDANPADSWLSGRRVPIDHILDDPRRGQAADINRSRS